MGFRTSLVLVGLLLAVAVGSWLLWQRWEEFSWQWTAYRLAESPSYSSAKSYFRQAQRAERLWPLVEQFGRGQQQFDIYLLQFAADPDCNDRFRKSLAFELGWRAEALQRWSHYHRWSSQQIPHEVYLELSAYLAAIAAADSEHQLTWRDVLDMQAMLAATGHADLAHQLTPQNWLRRYRAWVSRGGHNRHFWNVSRPAAPLPDWEGPLPARPAPPHGASIASVDANSPQ